MIKQIHVNNNFLFINDALRKIMHKPSKLPYSVQLDVTSYCNLKCDMCCRNFVGMKSSHIGLDKFKTIVNRLSGVREISLVGLGEPFAYPRIYEAIEFCKSRGLHVKTTTNGYLLNTDSKINKAILSGLDAISFSLDSCHNIDTSQNGSTDNNILTNIKRLIEMKNELGISTPKVTIQSVLFKDKEQDIYDIIKWSAENGVDRVNVLRLDLYFDTSLKRPNPREERLIFRELSRLRNIYNIRIDCLQDQFFTGLKGFLYKHLKFLLRLDSCCIRLLDYPQINQQGDMIPCCVLPKQTFGNIIEKNIKDVWHSNEFLNFRKVHNLMKICSKCDSWKLQQLL